MDAVAQHRQRQQSFQPGQRRGAQALARLPAQRGPDQGGGGGALGRPARVVRFAEQMAGLSRKVGDEGGALDLRHERASCGRRLAVARLNTRRSSASPDQANAL